MKALLDTHTLLWAGADTQRLSRTAQQVLRDPGNLLYVSAATAWEIATKVHIGKLPKGQLLEATLLDAVQQAGYEFISITPDDALTAGRFRAAHKDPWDRMIAAQALRRSGFSCRL